MSRTLVTVGLDDTLERIAFVLERNGIYHVVVTDEGAQVVGGISDREVLRGASPFVGKLAERIRDVGTQKIRDQLMRRNHRAAGRRTPASSRAEPARSRRAQRLRGCRRRSCHRCAQCDFAPCAERCREDRRSPGSICRARRNEAPDLAIGQSARPRPACAFFGGAGQGVDEVRREREAALRARDPRGKVARFRHVADTLQHADAMKA